MSNKLQDIAGRDDLVHFLNEFYAKAQADPIIGNKFNGLDMSAHIQHIADFWDSMMFGGQNFKGNPFGKHIPLNLKAEDFGRWLELFELTVESMFQGTKATEIINRAHSIATIFQYKLGLTDRFTT